MKWPAWLSPQQLGPVPLWLKVCWAGCVVFSVGLWFDHLVNWRWVWRWAAGSVSP